MRNFKKVIAAGLALLMLALSVNVSFAAESYTEKEAVVVAKVNAAGIMTGTDKGFEPSKTLTRAEAAAIMVRMKGISESTVSQNAGTTLFNDVAASHWAAGYINVASNYGIIKGVGAGKFAPEKEVTVAEFYTMAIRALNAGQLVEAEGTWPTNYVNFAIEYKLAEDVAQVYSVPATRMTAATIVANTLTAKMWVKDSVRTNGEITWKEGDNNILSSILNIAEYDHILIDNVNSKDLKADFDNTAEYDATETPARYSAAEIKAKAFDKDGYDVNERANISSAKTGMSYTIWVDTKEKEVLGFWVPEDAETLAFDDIKVKNVTPSGSIKLTIDGEDKKYDLGTFTLYVNGSAAASNKVPNVKYSLPGIAYYGTGSDKDKLVAIYVEDYDNYGLVSEVTSNKIKFEDLLEDTAKTITVDTSKDAKNVYNVTKDGKDASISDIKEGDVVFYYQTTNLTTSIKTYTIKVFTDVVEGKIKTESDNKVKIDGTEYTDLTKTLAAGDEIKAYLDEAGKILFYEKIEGSNGDYGVISAMRKSTDKYDASVVTYEVKITNLDTMEMSDWMEIDLDETKEETGVANYAATNILKSGEDATDASGYGKVFPYVIKGGKVVFTKGEKKFNNVAKTQIVRNVVKFNDLNNVDKITTDDSTPLVFYTTSGTKAFELDDNEKTTFAKREVKVKEIELDDIATNESITAGDVEVADIDFNNNNNTVGYIVFKNAKLQANKNWAFVLSAKSYNDDDNDDVKHIYSVAYADGTTATLYDESTTAKCAKGVLYELTVKDEVITDAKTTDETPTTGTHKADFNEDMLSNVQLGTNPVYLNKTFESRNTISFAEYVSASYAVNAKALTYAIGGTAESEVILDENLMVIIRNEDGKYRVGELDDIVALDQNDIPYTTTPSATEIRLNDKAVKDGYTKIDTMYTFKDVDGSSTTITVVAIVIDEAGFIPSAS